MDVSNAQSQQRRWGAPLRCHQRNRDAIGLVGSRYFRGPIEQDKSTVEMECHRARHHRFDLILLRTIPCITFTVRMT